MSDSALERVARAIWNRRNDLSGSRYKDRLETPHWEAAPEMHRLDVLEFARAAIGAMREPTQSMVIALLLADSHVDAWRCAVDEALK